MASLEDMRAGRTPPADPNSKSIQCAYCPETFRLHKDEEVPQKDGKPQCPSCRLGDLVETHPPGVHSRDQPDVRLVPISPDAFRDIDKGLGWLDRIWDAHRAGSRIREEWAKRAEVMTDEEHVDTKEKIATFFRSLGWEQVADAILDPPKETTE